jgi:hypothetical protein
MLSELQKANNPRCIEWSGHKNSYGYGQTGTMRFGNRKAHRWAWEKFFGPIPAELHVLHRCDNPACINPAHLFLGTHQENMRDRDLKGRHWNQARQVCRACGGPLTMVRGSGRRCAPCWKRKDVAWRKSHHEELIAYGRKYYREHREALLQQKRTEWAAKKCR